MTKNFNRLLNASFAAIRDKIDYSRYEVKPKPPVPRRKWFLPALSSLAAVACFAVILPVAILYSSLDKPIPDPEISDIKFNCYDTFSIGEYAGYLEYYDSYTTDQSDIFTVRIELIAPVDALYFKGESITAVLVRNDELLATQEDGAFRIAFESTGSYFVDFYFKSGYFAENNISDFVAKQRSGDVSPDEYVSHAIEGTIVRLCYGLELTDMSEMSYCIPTSKIRTYPKEEGVCETPEEALAKLNLPSTYVFDGYDTYGSVFYSNDEYLYLLYCYGVNRTVQIQRYVNFPIPNYELSPDDYLLSKFGGWKEDYEKVSTLRLDAYTASIYGNLKNDEEGKKFIVILYQDRALQDFYIVSFDLYLESEPFHLPSDVESILLSMTLTD